MSTQTEKSTWEKPLLALLAFQAVVALALATTALVNLPMLLEQFGSPYYEGMDILKYIMGYNLFLSLSISIWSIIWIRRKNIAGIQMATTLGFLMFGVSISVFLVFGRIDVLLFDGIRSLLMLVFGILAYQQAK